MIRVLLSVKLIVKRMSYFREKTDFQPLFSDDLLYAFQLNLCNNIIRSWFGETTGNSIENTLWAWLKFVWMTLICPTSSSVGTNYSLRLRQPWQTWLPRLHCKKHEKQRWHKWQPTCPSSESNHWSNQSSQMKKESDVILLIMNTTKNSRSSCLIIIFIEEITTHDRQRRKCHLDYVSQKEGHDKS